MSPRPLPRLTVRTLLLLCLRVGIGAAFIYASLDKIAHPDRLAEIVSDYQLLPDALVNPFSVMLPWVELATGVFLIVGRWLPSAALLSAGMTAVFMVAVAHAMGRGLNEFHCGCFTTAQEGGPTAAQVLERDALLLTACLALLILSAPAESSEGDRPGAGQSTENPI